MKFPWWGYVTLAGLAWGTYVPIIFFGGTELGGKANSRLMAILCVGIAYFVLAVIFPLALFMTGREEWPPVSSTGLAFSGLAGVAGALGAICVVFASKAAVDRAKLDGIDPATFRVLIAPMIFGLAPVINTVLSLVWHPRSGDPFHFGFKQPHWMLVVGVLLVSAGVFLVLYSKELSERAAKSPPAAASNPAPPH